MIRLIVPAPGRDAFVHHRVLAAVIAFLQKPFPPTVLAQMMRTTLDAVED